MKITKQQLMKIIKEEISAATAEPEKEEHEPVDLCDMSPSAAFGYAWNKAIESLNDNYPEAAKHLTALSEEEPESTEEPELAP